MFMETLCLNLLATAMEAFRMYHLISSEMLISMAEVFISMAQACKFIIF